MLFDRLRFLCLLALALGLGMTGEALAHGAAHGHAARDAVEAPLVLLEHDDSRSNRELSRSTVAPTADDAAASSHCPSGPGLGCGCGATVCAGSSAIVVSAAGFAFTAGAWMVSRPSFAGTFTCETFVLLSSPPRAPPLLSAL